MTSSTDEKDEGRELEARVMEGVEKQVSGGLCDNFAEEEEKVVFIFCAKENPWSWDNFHSLSPPPHLVPIALESELSEAENLSHHPPTTTLVIESYFSVMLTNAAHRWSTILKKCP